MKIIASIIGFVVIVAIVAVAFIYSGLYNVAATRPHSALMEWALSTTSDQSVAHHADGIKAPDLSGSAMIRAGFNKYHEDCEVCHGSPVQYPGEIGEGLNPKPPKLWQSAQEMQPGEMYWVIMHGIKMTGMPSWRHDYKEQDAWNVVAFLKQLPNISAQQYKQMVDQVRGTPMD